MVLISADKKSPRKDTKHTWTRELLRVIPWIGRPSRSPNVVSARQRHDGCSQPQPISVTPDFSAFSQYSLQYLLSFAAAQPHEPCLHLFRCLSSAITSASSVC